ncbi:MAG: type II toxin-antitoxin system VapC family toxin [Nitrospirae bacterium]|nr:type II toxin-antitoxin system VapC family toxin [Nitrospirota bacterium]
MNLVDSCGWLEYFSDGPNAGFFAAPIENVESLLVPSICIFEVFKRVLQQRDENAALHAAATMRRGLVVDLNSFIAISAARTSVDLNLPLADSVILATARAHGAMVWTQDADFERISWVKFIAKR